MSDPLDEAERYVELLMKEGLANRPKVPEKTGVCLARDCGEPTEGAFCSKECREDWEKVERLRKIQGK
jgi:hypothetical protein